VAEREHLEQTSNGVITVLTDILSLVDPVAFGRAQKIRERVREIGELVGVSPTWSVELAGLLSQLGVLTLPPEVLTKARGRQELTGTEKSMLSRVPEIGRDLLVHIPSFQEVGELVRLQAARFDGLGVGNGHLRGDQLPLGVRVLKVAIDQIQLESEGLAPTEAWSKLAEDSGAYDPDVLAAAEKIALGLSTRAPTTRVIARVGLMDLRLGWTLHQAVVAPDGTLLLGAGHTLTPAVLERIHNFAKVSGVRLPIVVERDEPVALAEPLLTS
jgi:HD-GYP domain-containing protein (c-di-GMP phosphodiesterase class II)